MTEPVDPNPLMPVWRPQTEPEPTPAAAPPFDPSYAVQPQSSYGAQPSYGMQPPYGMQPQPPYGMQPPSGQQPFGYAAPPAADGSRNGKVVVAVAAGLVAAGVVAIACVLVVHKNSSTADSKPVSLPTSFDGYSKIDSTQAQQVESSMRAMGGTDPVSTQLFSAASIGIYSNSGAATPSLVALTLPASKVPGGSAVSHDALVQGVLRGGIGTASAMPLAAGPHGGAVACGQTVRDAISVTMCAWSDDETLGTVVSVEPALPEPQLSAVQESLRDAIE